MNWGTWETLCISAPVISLRKTKKGVAELFRHCQSLEKQAVMGMDGHFLVISMCRDPGLWVQGCRNRPYSCSLGAGLGELPAAGSPDRQALAQLRVSTLIYVSTHPAELSLASAELHPPKHMEALVLGNIGKVKTPHQHTYTFKAGYKARFGINQTFSLLTLCILPITWNLKLFQSWVFARQSCVWYKGHTEACMMGRGGQKKLHG